LIDFRQEILDLFLKIIVDILLIQSKIYGLDYSKETVVESVESLCEVDYPWKRVKNIREVHQKCYDSIFPPTENEEVRDPIVKPSAVV